MRRMAIVVMAALAGTLVMASGASAKGGEFGDTCVAQRAGSPFGNVWETSRREDPLPEAAPVSGVLTKWVVRVPSEYPSIPSSSRRG